MSALIVAVLLLAVPSVDEVVVYPDRAQVTRVGEVSCAAKVKTLFTGITPAAAADSFRARVTQGQVLGLRTEQQVRAEEFGPALKDAQDKLKALDAQREGLLQDLARADNQARLAQELANVSSTLMSRELVSGASDARAWAQSVEAPTKALLAANNLRVDTATKLRTVDAQRDVWLRKIAQLQQWSRRSEWQAEVLVNCPAGKTARVELTYMVGGAQWSPAYEARADEAGGKVELSTWATVQQVTGEDWKSARITLSTAVPAQNATPPEVQKLLVHSVEQKPEKKVLVRRDEEVSHAGVSASNASGNTALPARAQGLSVQLQVPERGTVVGDGTPVRLFVAKTPLKATFSFRSVPRLQPYVFRVADLSNQAPFPFLAGPLDAYRATGFVSRYHLERVAEGALFTLSFGAEDSVRIKRVVVEELKRDVGLFNGKKRFNYAYRFELAHYGKSPVEVEVAEGLPVSELDDVTVAVNAKTTAGYQIDSQDGIARWKVALKPGDKRNVDVAFQVDVPNSYDTGND
ncbi:MAG: mucoidy inhibitor MuiA family protein [Myxococcaceae bacterium]|nr:mucoidy inhibitor MuiA family protein [Myxococcaceae bacterium]